MQTIDEVFRQGKEASRSNRLQEAAQFYKQAALQLRSSPDRALLAYSLRHAAATCSRLGDLDTAEFQINEAIEVYREQADQCALDLANALRISALNHERQSKAACLEAESLYRTFAVQAGVDEALRHVHHLSKLDTPGDNSDS